MSIQTHAKTRIASAFRHKPDAPISSDTHVKLFVFAIIMGFMTIVFLYEYDGAILPLFLIAAFIAFGVIMTHLKRDISYLRHASTILYGLLGLILAVVVFWIIDAELYAAQRPHNDEGFDWASFFGSIFEAFAIWAGALMVLQGLFFGPLIKHAGWIEANGLFSWRSRRHVIPGKPRGNARSALIQGRLNEHSVADELQKWAHLRDQGIVSDDEYHQARDALMRQIG